MTTTRAFAYAPDSPEGAVAARASGGKLVFFVRHGEALHKGRTCTCGTATRCAYIDDTLVDAALTREGHAQVRGIGNTSGAEVVLVSTAVRALETAVDAFPSTTPIVALEELRSRTSEHSHTKRLPLSSLRRQFPRASFPDDAGDADTLWTGTPEPRAHVDERVRAFLALLLARPEQRIAVVTHFTMFLALLLPAHDLLVLGENPARPADDPPYLDASRCSLARSLTALLPAGELRALIVVPR